MKPIKQFIAALNIPAFLFFACIFYTADIMAQNAGVNYTGAKPHASALLDISDSAGAHKGLLIPRMTKAQRGTIASPARGLIIFQTDSTPGFYYNSSTNPASPAWVNIASSGAGGSQWITNNLGITGGSTIIGGTGVSDSLILRSTSGAGTTGADIIFQGGNNGAAEAMRIKTRPSQTVSASGGAITFSGGYTIHTFTTSGTFTPSASMQVEYLAVGGGGGGGANDGVSQNPGGGGGSGGMLTGTGFGLTAQPYSVIVGNGGGFNTNGSNSVFSSIIALGGGKGGFEANGSGGGSGGGGSGWFTTPSHTGGTGTIGQGNNGGDGTNSSVPNRGSGGGGGAGASGGNGVTSNAGSGGQGITSSISGVFIRYAGGGGGGANTGGVAGNGGVGGGGAGGVGTGSDGAPNTGGGGGGGGGASGSNNGGNGGSGIVIIRYLTSSATPTEDIVGIGTSSPTEKLDVAGNIRLSGALMPNNNAGTNGQVLTSSGAWAPPTWASPAGGVTSVSASAPLSVSGTSSPTIAVTGILPVANGGTNSSLANTGFNNLAPSQTSNSGKFLTTDGSNTSWGTVPSSQWTTSGSNIYYNSGLVGIGTGTATPGASLHVIGTGTTSSTYALKIQNSYSVSLFNVRNDGNITAGLISNSNLFVGALSGSNVTTTKASTAFGVGAQNSVTTGVNNTAMGTDALSQNTAGDENTAVGTNALYYNTTSNNVAFGSTALYHNTTGSNNTALSLQALASNTTGASNVAVGRQCLYSKVTGNWNTAVGTYAFSSTTASSGNVGLGYAAGYYETESNKLFIDNTLRASEADARVKALIYGVFGTNPIDQHLTINATVTTQDSLERWAEEVIVPDDGTIVLPSSQSGWGQVLSFASGTCDGLISFRFNSDGSVTEMAVADALNSSVTDTDNKLCAFDSGTTVTIKNRLGGSRTLKIKINY